LLQGGAAEQMRMRAELYNLMRDNNNLFIMDKEQEEFFITATPLSTLDALQAQAQEQMAAVSHIPLVILLGITPTGLNTSTDGEMTAWRQWVRASQEHLFARPLKKVLHLLQLNRFGEIDPDIDFEFNPLEEANEKEASEVGKALADTVAVYAGLGAIGPAEIRKMVANDEKLPFEDIDLSEPAPGEDPAFEGTAGTGSFGKAQPEPGMMPGAAPGGMPGAPDLQAGENSILKHAVTAKDDEAAGGPNVTNNVTGRKYGAMHIHLHGGAEDADMDPTHKYDFEDGIRVGIETPKGEIRKGSGWSVTMPADYGYIYRTKGHDGDRVDCFVGPYAPEQLPVFIVHQYRAGTDIFDEHKVMLGFPNITDALAVYDASFDDGLGKDRRPKVEQLTFGELKTWLSTERKRMEDHTVIGNDDDY
jgi:hypothetical protein